MPNNRTAPQLVEIAIKDALDPGVPVSAVDAHGCGFVRVSLTVIQNNGSKSACLGTSNHQKTKRVRRSPSLSKSSDMPLDCGLLTGVKQDFSLSCCVKIRVSFAVLALPLSDRTSTCSGARCVPNRRATACLSMSRRSDPLIPAFAMAHRAMISRSCALMRKAMRITSPFQQANSGLSLPHRRFDRIMMTLPSWFRSGRSKPERSRSKLLRSIIR